MCGRYIVLNSEAIQQLFSVLPPDDWQDRFNVAPSQDVPTVRLIEGQRVLTLMRWGLIPRFAQGVAGNFSTINARVETIRTSAAYREPWRKGQRCLVLASAFYEWQEVPGGKQPHYIGCADQEVFAFAGLWDGSTPSGGVPILSCTIVTLPASPLMAQIHNTRQREPAILRPEDHDIWLKGSSEAAFACLRQYPDELRSAWPVSTQVNSPKNQGPALMARL
ncbi:MAG: SOS response-associated peptidase [Pseudomonadota bacterium]